MKKIQATYQIQTPMFLGNQSGTCPTEIRPTAFKGALRFWWRALQWSAFINEHQNQSEALKALHKAEAELFGISAQSDGSGGQGKVLITTTNEPFKIIDYSTAAKGKSFLAYGMQGNPKIPGSERSAIDVNQTFTAKLLTKPSITEQQLDSIKDALTILGLVGSLGAKSRKGFGSLGIQSLEIGETHQSFSIKNMAEYKGAISGVMKNYSLACVNDLPPYTAFSKHCLLGASSNDFKVISKKYLEFLSENENNRKKEFFGLPRKKYGDSGKERRISPLFIHIHQIDHKEVPILVLMPAIWNPTRRDSETNISQFSLPTAWFNEQASQRIGL